MTEKSRNLFYKFVGGVTVATLVAIGLWWLNSLDDEEEFSDFIQNADNDSNINFNENHTKIKIVISGKNVLFFFFFFFFFFF